MSSGAAGEVMGALAEAVDGFQSLDLDSLTAEEAMAVARACEVVLRRVQAGADRVAGHLDVTGAHGVDGHKTAKAAIVHLGRVSGAEAFGRVRTDRCMRQLPAVADAYARGEIPVEAARAIARLWSNPRVQPLLNDVIAKLLAERAATDHHAGLLGWLRDLEAAADPDGTGEASEQTHARRRAQLTQNPIDGSWELRGNCGALQGAAMDEVLKAYLLAEWETDRAEAIARYGPGATPDQFPRTPAQRLMDAVAAIFAAAGSTPADAQRPEPIVSIIVDLETLEDEIARLAGDGPTGLGDQRPADTARVDDIAERRICRTVSGRPLHPSDAVAALLVGHLRRVVVDSASNVIDLGRRSRLFTGSARDAAFLQAAIRARGGHRCFWSGCDGAPLREQCDHVRPWGSHGRSDVSNSDIGCGFHNRLKEAGFRPERRPDGRYHLVRPDGTPITPSA